MPDDRSTFRDGLLLSVGTLTALPVPPPTVVDRRAARTSMLIAPLAVVPVALVSAAIAWGGAEADLNPFAIGFVIVGFIAWATRGLHLDGLSDVADGLTASHEKERSLAVMKDSAAGPAGVAALVVVLGLQAVAIAGLVESGRGPWVVALLICLSRATLALACTAGVPAARPDGLAVTFAGVVPRSATALLWLTAAAAAGGVFAWAGTDWWRGAVAVAVGFVAAVLVIAHCVRRFGGVTGDVFGAAIELSLAAMLLAV